MFLLDKAIPHLHINSMEAEGPKSNLKKVTMLVLAVTIHNFPEGMAVGAVAAAFLQGQEQAISFAAALSLALGIAIQNFPEGAIISLPLKSSGGGKGKSFLYGALSGAVEPAAALLTIALFRLLLPAMPILLSFAAGAMLFVVVEELIPEASEGKHSNAGTAGFGAGFVLMMILDVALG